MRAVLAASLFIAIAFTGCFTGGTDDPPLPPAPTTGSITGNVTDGESPLEGIRIRLGIDGAISTTDAEGHFAFHDLAPGSYGVNLLDKAGTTAKQALVQVFAGQTTPVEFVLDLDTVEDPDDEPSLPLGSFDCDGTTVQEPTLTYGQDADFHGMTWGALKTGFRFAVALPGVDGATLEYRVNNGPAVTIDLSAQSDPLFVFDAIAPGTEDGSHVICFTPTVNGASGPTHAARLGNGPTSWDERSNTYSLNIYIFSAEGVERDILEDGVPIYTQTLWDATDGLMRAGAVFILYGDAQSAAATIDPCTTPAVTLTGLYFGAEGAVCGNLFDIYFTYQENPLAAGSTPRRGLEGPFSSIRMNQLYEAGPFLASDADEIGKVFTHELGHYAQGFDDMYASLAGGPDCYDAATSISVMGSNRDATEYDDELHQCPNIDTIEADGQVYVPTWTRWQEWYTQVPERTEINPGPDGDGGFMGTVVMDWA